MALKTWYDKEIAHNLGSECVAILGYGSQGRAQALNLHDSGVDVVVGLREDSSSVAEAVRDGLTVVKIADAIARADLIAFLTPDETHKDVYQSHVAANARAGAALVFAHGFSIHYGLIEPRADLDAVLVAPKGVGFQLRRAYLAGAGVPGLIAIAQDHTGQARERALAYGKALGCGRAGVMETTFKDETETDLFGEQAVLCGGVPELVRRAFECLTGAGYPPELAYFECLHELKLICDLLHARGIAGMSEAISNTAEFGALRNGRRVIGDHASERMREVLTDIQSGRFTTAFIDEARAGFPALEQARREVRSHPVEKVGSRLRQMMASSVEDENGA